MAETFISLGKKVYRVKDPCGSYIDVVPEQGNTIIGFHVPYQKDNLNILYQPDDFVNKSGGIPVMWPFANRIKDGRFFRNNRDHRILGIPHTTDDKAGNAIHGMVRKARWEVIDSGSDKNGLFISSRINSKNFPEIEEHFGQGILTVTYALRENVLTILTEIQNTGDLTFPMCWAFHPWFKAPLTDQGLRRDMTVEIPATRRWESSKGIPNGNLLPVKNEFDFQQGKRLYNLEFDDVYTGLTFTEQNGKKVSVVKISDQERGIEISVTSDSIYKNLVFFAPLNKPTLCIEPQTSPTNAFNMADEMADLILLQPGKKVNAEFKITVFIKERK